ncbi:hypothetical protein ACF09H_04865 [Streptomyces sp. NPDC014983]|uniref:hypothetical protein n=1 Tax=Streptomyces sp. NPDC014983 TaxID=3364933 RepID=UPI0037022B94
MAGAIGPGAAQVRSVSQAFRKRYGRPPGCWATEGHDAANLLVRQLIQVLAPNPTDLVILIDRRVSRTTPVGMISLVTPVHVVDRGRLARIGHQPSVAFGVLSGTYRDYAMQAAPRTRATTGTRGWGRIDPAGRPAVTVARHGREGRAAGGPELPGELVAISKAPGGLAILGAGAVAPAADADDAHRIRPRAGAAGPGVRADSR